MNQKLPNGISGSNDRRVSILEGVILIQFAPGTLVSPQLFLDIFQEFSAEPEIYHNANHVWDLRNILPDAEMGFQQMIRMVRHLQSKWESHWNLRKTALVVSSKAVFGLSRMYATLAEDNLEFEVKVFEKDLDAALAWARSEN